MTDRPILFTGPMVRALLDGRKTQTRRIVTMPKYRGHSEFGPSDTPGYDWHFRDKEKRWNDVRHSRLLELLPYAVGDRLWVREAFSGPHGCRNLPPRDWPMGCPIWRWADGDPVEGDWTKPKPSMFMPRWASRLTLVVTEIRVERLQDISPFDALAEGMCPDEQDEGDPDAREIEAYRDLWGSLNAKRDFGWDANPWVVALTFTVHQRNIDNVT